MSGNILPRTTQGESLPLDPTQASEVYGNALVNPERTFGSQHMMDVPDLLPLKGLASASSKTYDFEAGTEKTDDADNA